MRYLRCICWYLFMIFYSNNNTRECKTITWVQETWSENISLWLELDKLQYLFHKILCHTHSGCLGSTTEELDVLLGLDEIWELREWTEWGGRVSIEVWEMILDDIRKYKSSFPTLIWPQVFSTVFKTFFSMKMIQWYDSINILDMRLEFATNCMIFTQFDLQVLTIIINGNGIPCISCMHTNEKHE